MDTSSIRSGSMRSGNTSDMSETSSQRSDARMLRKHKRSAEEHDEGDLLEQRRSLQEGVFACMYTLVRQSAFSSWKFAVLKVLLEGLMPFIVVFNPSAVWAIDTSNPVWQIVRWVVWRSPIMRLYGYRVYVIVMYVMAGAVLLAVAGLVWLTLAMRKQEQSKWLRRMAAVLHVVYELIFMIFYVSFLDYFVFMANCKFTEPGTEHEYFEGVKCLQMPHILHMSVGLLAAVVHFCVTALLVVASSDLNPLSSAYLASPDAISRIKILVAKAALIVIADDLQSWPKPQVVLLVIAAGFTCWYNFRKLPFYRALVNVMWCSMWTCVLYATVIQAALQLGGDHSWERRREYTMYVLYGVFPVLAGSMVICAVHAWWAMRPARKFAELPSFRDVRVQQLHKFADVNQVELLSRVMRKFNHDDAGVEDDAAALGEAVIRAGMLTFPNSPFLYILYANFLLGVRKDGPAARTQLQLAAKHSPSLVERYQVYCTLEVSKRLKDSQDGGMDLQAYIEFRRNFKAVLRVHRDVLSLELELWRTCLRSTLRVAMVDELLDELEAATARAHQVYRKVLERYPTNGKLLRCYGKFLEDVCHDGAAAARAYAEAARNGGADAIMSLDLSSVQQASNKPEFLTSLSLMDDAVVVINAAGTIMMVSQAVQLVFGYSKAELEGVNVALLMPQPFSQRHDGYLARYVATAEAHILDRVREVVALHKDRYVFPVSLCVTKMSGSGSDSVFLGVVRPLPPSTLRTRAWLAPNGTFLCGDQQFASLCGLTEKDLVGRSLASLCANPEDEVAALLERFRTASPEQLAAGSVRADLLLRHRFLEPVAVEALAGLAGTTNQRIVALSCRRTDGQEGSILVVDTHMRIRFASLGVAALLNYPMRQLASMRLNQLLPPPFDSLHAKWLRDPPHKPSPTGCRQGRVVQLLNDAGVPVPVRIKVHTAAGDDPGVSLYVVQIEKVHPDEVMEEKRLVLTADISGKVLAVSRPGAPLFGFPAVDMVGRSLCDTIDVFGEWRKRNGESQLQLLILALIDREQEMPGTSWRVRVHSPASAEDPAAAASNLPPLSAALPSMRRKAGTGAISACLQVELEDDLTGASAAAGGGTDLLAYDDDDIFGARAAAAAAAAAAAGGGDDAAAAGPGADGDAAAIRIRLTLWRRDMLTGIVELDEHLVIRRASPLTGLIVGLPSTAMLRKPLTKFLDLPQHRSWVDITEAARGSHGHNHKRSALKAGAERGRVSPQMAFVGPHPDMGTMRIVVQGVQTLAPGAKQKVTLTLHPDTTFVGAHANLMRVLHLDTVDNGDGAASRPHTTKATAEDLRLGTSGGGGGASAAARGSRRTGSMKARGAAAAAAGDGARSDGRSDGSASDSIPEGSGDDEQEEEEEEAEEEEEDGRGGGSGASSESGGGGDAGPSGPDAEAKGQAALLRKASSKSEFVAQWVRTVSKRILGGSGRLNPDLKPEGGAEAAPASAPASVSAAQEATAAAPLASPGDGAPTGPSQPAAAAPPPPVPFTSCGSLTRFSAAPPLHPSALKHPPGGNRLAAIPEGLDPVAEEAESDDEEAELGGGAAAGAGAGAAAGGRGGGGGGDKWEVASEGGESSADGSQAASGVTSVTDGQSSFEVVVDSRRGRLLKSLRKVLMGPMLMVPLERLRLHSYLLLILMLVTHIACYVVVSRVISSEHTGVYLVHRQARAMDRAELLVVRILIGTYCERPNITAKVSACTPPLSVHLANMVASVNTMEQDHQGVYLGFSRDKVSPPSTRVYDIWTKPMWGSHVYMDTQPPRVQTESTGVWQLGNRFIAASREALYWMPRLREKFKFHRVYQFMVTNGLGPLFVGYATSLDELMAAAWSSLDKLRSALIVVLIVEVLVVQLSCLGYEWLLMHRLERARLQGVLCMIGLPGPVLRQMGHRDIKVLDESDAEMDDDDAADGQEQRDRTADVKEGRKEGDGDGEAAGDGDAASMAAGGAATTSAGVRLLPAAPTVAGAGAADSPPRQKEYSPTRNPDDDEQDGGGGGRRASVDGPGGGGEEYSIVAATGRGRRTSMEAYEKSGKELTLLGAAAPDDDGASTATAASAAAGVGRYGGPGGARRRRSRWADSATGTMYVNGKALIPSKWRGFKFMLIPVLWLSAVLSIYIVSILSLSGMQGPLAALNMASHVAYRYTRIRAVGFSFISQDDSVSKALWRDMLRTEVRLFVSEYNALMYGGTAASQANSVFTHSVPPSTFASSAFADAFFRTKRCFRYNQTLCAQPGSPYYEVTHNGLDVMVRRMITEMELLISDADEDVIYNATRWTFMYNVGTFDLYEGLQQAAQLFVDFSISRYNQVTMLHTILLVVTIGLFVVYIIFVLWPHLAKLKADAARQSALLSHVPSEVDAVAHVKAVCRAARPSKGALKRSSYAKTQVAPAATAAGV